MLCCWITLFFIYRTIQQLRSLLWLWNIGRSGSRLSTSHPLIYSLTHWRPSPTQQIYYKTRNRLIFVLLFYLSPQSYRLLKIIRPFFVCFLCIFSAHLQFSGILWKAKNIRLIFGSFKSFILGAYQHPRVLTFLLTISQPASYVFHAHSATQSTAIRPLIPWTSGLRSHADSATLISKRGKIIIIYHPSHYRSKGRLWRGCRCV